MPSPKPSPQAVAACRAALLGDHVPLRVLAAALHRSPKTVKRMDLPGVRIGNVDYVNVPLARERFGLDRVEAASASPTTTA